MTMTSSGPSAPARPKFEAFKCYGTAAIRHGDNGRTLVEVDWENRLVRKKCEGCRKWHTFVSQEESRD